MNAGRSIVRVTRYVVLSLVFTGGITHLIPAVADTGDEASTQSRFSYGSQGFQFDDGTGNNYLWFGVRVQPRWSYQAFEDDELTGTPIDESGEFKLQRGRLKLGGHLISPAFTVYSEYDFVDNRLLDLRATYQFAPWLSIRVGQWKSEYNRERIDSSGKQQFVERSIVTPWFTVDRQKAVMASGTLGRNGRKDVSYWAGRLSGAGRGGDTSDADGLWLARAQWNLHGRILGFSQSALKRSEKPLGSIAVAAVNGKSGFTAFSSAGGGQLPGFENGAPDEYRLEQWIIETAYQHGGFSWQQEFHWKRIEDRFTGQSTRLKGGYIQAGMFFSELIDRFPRPLEFALRVARVDPDRVTSGAREREYTIASNWFFNGHRNKLTFDVSRVTRRETPEPDTAHRVRLQWDWSF